MKESLSLVIGLAATLLVAGAEEIPHWTELKKSPEGTMLLRLSDAILKFHSSEKRLPENLGELVSESVIDPKHLFWKRKDGALQCPLYYTGPFKGGRIVLRMQPDGVDYSLFVRLDGSIGAEAKANVPNKVE